MARSKKLDFHIDKLTNSIENTTTGEVFDTEIVRLNAANKSQIRKSDWVFNWHLELVDLSNRFSNLRPKTIQ
jgi:hypothetical protein